LVQAADAEVCAALAAFSRFVGADFRQLLLQSPMSAHDVGGRLPLPATQFVGDDEMACCFCCGCVRQKVARCDRYCAATKCPLLGGIATDGEERPARQFKMASAVWIDPRQ